MIKQLDFAEPFFSVDYIEDEQEYYVDKCSIVVNLAERTGQVMYVDNLAINPLKTVILEGVKVTNIGRAMIVKDFRRCDLEDVETRRAIKAAWPSLYAMSGLERHKGLPFYKSPKFITGEGRNHLELNFCFAAEPYNTTGLHQYHPRPIDEVHLQVLGTGKVKMYHENDESTFFGEHVITEGCTHEKTYNETGYYPWHQYQSVTTGIFCPIELNEDDE